MGKPELPSPLEAVWNVLAKSSRMVRSDGGLMRAVPTNTVPESFPLGGILRLPKQSAMSFRLPK
jgi:hypothetical protein